ncbi:MAG: acyl carrier protein [Rhodocyclaceae bacterium]|nr:acyl carrier protein [Rhodocyclaceae bacterium]
MDSKQAIRRFIVDELLSGDDQITDDDNLLRDGMVDSLGMLRLVSHMEELAGRKIPPTDFTVENFRDINALGSYLRRLMDDRGPGHGG